MWTGGVRVIVLDEEGRMLLVKQHHEDKDIWMVPGGGIEEGEGARQAAVREVKEETGADASVIKYVGIENRRGRIRFSFLNKLIENDINIIEKHCIVKKEKELKMFDR